MLVRLVMFTDIKAAYKCGRLVATLLVDVRWLQCVVIDGIQESRHDIVEERLFTSPRVVPHRC